MDNDTKIILITGNFEKEDRFGVGTGEYETLVSHGIGNVTLENYVLPNDPISHFDKLQYDPEIGDYYINIVKPTNNEESDD